MIVLDASAVLDGLLDAAADAELTALLTGASEPLAAPDLLDVETLSVLRRWERRGEIDTGRARQALADLGELPVLRYPARILTDRAWRLRHNLTAYDAQYVALAQELRATLATTDERLAAAAKTARVPLWESG
ncbi:MAG: type II toxin-antitoxin system VapC family toxin [Solirubrobacterales bacterium]|nr:type II toxin-antitoxin system VapC family toxin [Solirubrobacterales bacterium]MBV8992080.1 type II toxin-antitoxin system VapC family toxin [Solirubrobacterales bacterium]MBV9050223.1 type II toxin-antitoxin system VapC family toxin [Solirubrobacterales bacterium]